MEDKIICNFRGFVFFVRFGPQLSLSHASFNQVVFFGFLTQAPQLDDGNDPPPSNTERRTCLASMLSQENQRESAPYLPHRYFPKHRRLGEGRCGALKFYLWVFWKSGWEVGRGRRKGGNSSRHPDIYGQSNDMSYTPLNEKRPPAFKTSALLQHAMNDKPYLL